jgi:glycosyltransferase involved in cell wall biosynthesis
MPAANPVSDRPFVSVIVPARNEEVALGACLESLVAQTGVNKEIIVVDDGSTDRTREIAESFAVKVIEPGPLPEGWTGKNNAVSAGAKIARGEWLLFTDADTVHIPGSLASSLKEARKEKVSLLSYSPEQEVHSFWENAVMPVIFAELASTYKPSDVSNPKSPAAAANGQYVLITREAYDAVGGHAAVATDLLEDVALAKRVKATGRKIFFRFAGDAVRTRMYRTFSQLREGWTKNLVLLFPEPQRLATLRLLEFVLIVGSLAAAIFEIVQHRAYPAIAAAIICVALFDMFMGRIKKAHFSFKANAAAIFGLPLFAYLLLRSRLFHKNGKVQWKGRSYAGRAMNDVGTAAVTVQAECNEATPHHI